MNIIQEQFFLLVNAGLWKTPIDERMFQSPVDWNGIFELAKGQSIAGITFDGLQTLPKDLFPNRILYLKWCNKVISIEEKNKLLNRELTNIYKLYRENGIEPVLLKGQGVAQNYPNPLHRQSGDVDLYIGKKNFEKANSLLRAEATNEVEETYKHTTITWHGIIIENHYNLCQLNSPWANRKFQNEIDRWHNTDRCQQIDINGCLVTMPPVTFNVSYVLVHSLLHFINEGVGLRQICDLNMLLKDIDTDEKRNQIANLLRQWGIEKAARSFGYVMVKHLGLDEQYLPIKFTENDITSGEVLFNSILNDGNFGRMNKDIKERPKNYWAGKLYTFTRAYNRCSKFRSIAFTEATFYPIVLFIHSLNVQIKRRLS